MRLNVNKYQGLMNKQNIDIADIERQTGLTVKTLEWIFDNGFLEAETLGRLAEVVGCNTSEIGLTDLDNIENAIEWLRDRKRATVSFTQGRMITKIKKLAEARPEECQIVAENKDGSICAHIPTRWVKIVPSRQMSESERKVMEEKMQKARASIGTK